MPEKKFWLRLLYGMESYSRTPTEGNYITAYRDHTGTGSHGFMVEILGCRQGERFSPGAYQLCSIGNDGRL